MKRPMTLTAGILGIVAQSAAMIFSLLAILTCAMGIGNDPYYDSFFTMGLVIFIILLGATIVGLIFNIRSLICWKKSIEDYKKGSTIVAIVFNFIVVVFGFLTGNVFGVIVSLMLIATAVLQIVDISLEGRRAVSAADAQEVEVTKVQPVKKNLVKTEIDQLAEKIEKLNELKEKGLINEKEYTEIKKKYIQDKING